MSVDAADFDADGNLDLVFALEASDSVSLLKGDGTGSFALPIKFPTGDGPSFVVCRDFNRDGKADIATCNYNAANLSILLGTGSGSFGATTTAFPVPANNTPVCMVSADINKDSIADLIVGSQQQYASVFLGTGTGTFGSCTSYTAGYPTGVTVADFNGDGKLDMATTGYFTNKIYVYHGSGTGTFGSPTVIPTCNSPHPIVSADFNNDGKIDLATANDNSNTVAILLNSGSNSFTTAPTVTVGTNPIALSAADYDFDGNIDLAAANINSNNISVLRGDGAGNFSVTTHAVNSRPISIASYDLNHDGRLDLAVAGQNGSVSILLNSATLGHLENQPKDQFRLYPNPNISSLIIEANTGEPSNVDIYNSSGELLFQRKFNQKLEIAHLLPAGVYFATIRSKDKISHQRFIVIK
jgi:hypothetical protein